MSFDEAIFQVFESSNLRKICWNFFCSVRSFADFPSRLPCTHFCLVIFIFKGRRKKNKCLECAVEPSRRGTGKISAGRIGTFLLLLVSLRFYKALARWNKVFLAAAASAGILSFAWPLVVRVDPRHFSPRFFDW